MPRYWVRWEIDVDAGSPQEAAEKALAVHRDQDSIATVFDVYEMVEDRGLVGKAAVFTRVDLDEDLMTVMEG